MKILQNPPWREVKNQKKYPILTEDINADIAVIGAGISGITSAYLLAKAGFDVVLIDSGAIGAQTTAYTTAFITEIIDTDLRDLIKIYGTKDAKRIWQSHEAAITEIARIVKEENIDCDFMRCSSFVYANEPADLATIEKEYAAAKKLGFPVKMQYKKAAGFNNYGYMELKDQAKFHPAKFVNALAQKASQNGVRIFENTAALKIEHPKKNTKKDPRDDREYLIIHAKNSKSKKQFSIKARDVIIATYKPFNNELSTFMKKGMYVSYILAACIPAGLIKPAIYEDTGNPYHYFRIDAAAANQGKSKEKFDEITIGGEDHREEIKMDEQKNFAALEAYLKKIISPAAYAITRTWSGPILEPSDGLALIGEAKPHQWVASAFSGNGMTYALIAAMLFRDALTGKKNPWQKLYDPKRIPGPYQLLKKGKDYAEELIQGAVKNSLRSSKEK